MKRIFTYVSTAALLLATIVSITSSTVSAAATSSGLSITPRKNLNITPGQTVSDKLTIGNLNPSADLIVTLKVIDFTYTDDSGTPKLFLADNAPQTSWSIKPFTTLPKEIIVPAGQSRSVPYTVKVPANQGAGSYYSAIQYGTAASEGGNVSLSASGVSLVFVSVPGVVQESMILKKLGAYQPSADGIGGRYLSVTTNPPLQIAYTLQNSGNVAESPASSMVVKYMFGGRVWKIDNANERASLALIGQSRLFTSCLISESKDVTVAGNTASTKVCRKPSLWPGRYTASLDTFYGQNGNATHEVTGVAHFWYLPIWFIIAAVVVIAGIVIFVVVISRKIRHALNGTGAKRRRR